MGLGRALDDERFGLFESESTFPAKRRSFFNEAIVEFNLGFPDTSSLSSVMLSASNPLCF